jgi:hypothetical protein
MSHRADAQGSGLQPATGTAGSLSRAPVYTDGRPVT